MQLMLVRNPWGAEQYSGPWSDGWSGWTDADRQAIIDAGGWDLPDGVSNDGLFYMDIDSYMVNFSVTQINQDTHNWKHGWFLMRDDPLSAETTDPNGDGKTRHQIKVKNEGEAQYIWVGAHIWQDRTYCWVNAHSSGACNYSSATHFFNGAAFSPWQGSTWSLHNFGAGEEKTFEGIFDWRVDEYERRRDWSVTAWGTNYDVTVSHALGIDSSHSPTYDDGMRSVPEEITEYPAPPPPPPQTCWDTNNGAVDPYNDGCAAYQGNEGWCNNYDDADFISMEMCCACGGGCPCDPDDADCACGGNDDGGDEADDGGDDGNDPDDGGDDGNDPDDGGDDADDGDNTQTCWDNDKGG